MKQALLWAAGGTGFTFLMTTLGAAMVFLFRGKINMKIQRIFLGFAAGVMIAASVWSLLIPAIEEAEAAGKVGWIPAAGGFVLGIVFLLLMDQLLPHLHAGSKEPEGLSSSWKRTTLLVMAVTLHNSIWGLKQVWQRHLHWRWASVFRTSRKGRLYPCRCVRKGFPAGRPFFTEAFPVL